MKERESQKWLRMMQWYRVFMRNEPDRESDPDGYDFTGEAATVQYVYESRGGVKPDVMNGYSAAKHLLDVTVGQWKEGLDEGTLTKKELYEDSNLPDWYLDMVIRDYPINTERRRR